MKHLIYGVDVHGDRHYLNLDDQENGRMIHKDDSGMVMAYRFDERSVQAVIRMTSKLYPNLKDWDSVEVDI